MPSSQNTGRISTRPNFASEEEEMLEGVVYAIMLKFYEGGIESGNSFSIRQISDGDCKLITALGAIRRIHTGFGQLCFLVARGSGPLFVASAVRTICDCQHTMAMHAWWIADKIRRIVEGDIIHGHGKVIQSNNTGVEVSTAVAILTP